MLHWQRLLKQLNYLSPGAKALLLSSVSHFCILFVLLFMYKGLSHIAITVTPTTIGTDAKIVFLPLHKSYTKLVRGTKTKSVRSKSLQHSSSAISPIANAQKISQDTNSLKTTLSHGPEIKKNISEGAKKKLLSATLNNKNIQLSKKIPLSQKIKKPKNAVPVISDKKTDLLAVPEEKKLAKALENKVSIVPEVQELPVPHEPLALAEHEEDILYVGQQEMDELQVQDYIQKEAAQHWRPPLGIKNNTQCTVRVTIHFDGTIKKVFIEHSSSILLFDGAAQRAACQIIPPRWAYGKELSITFKA